MARNSYFMTNRKNREIESYQVSLGSQSSREEVWPELYFVKITLAVLWEMDWKGARTGGREISIDKRLSSRSCAVSPKRTDLEWIGGNIKEADSSIKYLKKTPSPTF